MFGLDSQPANLQALSLAKQAADRSADMSAVLGKLDCAAAVEGGHGVWQPRSLKCCLGPMVDVSDIVISAEIIRRTLDRPRMSRL